LAQALTGFDALLVAGAPVFTFRVEGHCALFDPGGPAIWQLTADPAAANAGTGTAILGDVRRALEGLAAVLPQATGPCRPAGRTRPRARAARRRYADGRAGAAARGAVDAG